MWPAPLSINLFRIHLQQKRPHTPFKQDTMTQVLPPHQHSLHAQRGRHVIRRTSAARRLLTGLLLNYGLTYLHLRCLKSTWRRATSDSRLLLHQMQYMQLTYNWVKYTTSLQRAIVSIPQAHKERWLPTIHQRVYDFAALLTEYLTPNDLTNIYFMLYKKQPQRVILYLQETLSHAPMRQQKKLFLDFCRYLKILQQRAPLRTQLHGIRATLKGKINRSGSARKQKIIWQLGSIRRGDFQNRLYFTRAQVCTPAGALGLELQFNYKVECFRKLIMI